MQIKPHVLRTGAARFAVVLCALGGIAGCGGMAGAPKVVPVKGQVAVNGTTLEGLGVSFRPDTSKGNTTQFIPTGTTNEDGEYELMTGTEKGAPVGWYKVVVMAPTPPIMGGEAPKSGPPPFDPKFANPNTTPLSVEVKDEAKPEPIDLELTK